MEGIFVGIILLVGTVTGVVANEVTIARQKHLEEVKAKQDQQKEAVSGVETSGE